MSEIEEEIRRQMLAERGLAAPAPVAPPPAPPRESTLHRWQSKGGLAGGIATALLLLAKFGTPVLALLGKLKGLLVGLKFLSFTKVFVAGGSMLASMWLESAVFGWTLAAGIVLLIFVHECGHAFAGRLRGLPIRGMVFIPFMGAAVALQRGGRSVAEDAFIGIMGPVFGTLGGLACLGLYLVFPSHFWLVLAHWNFLINLFNLAPMPPLDGGWITPVFSPKLLAAGVVLLFVLLPHNPMIWVLALMSLPRILGGWHARPDQNPYYRASAADRWKFGLAYLGLALILAAANTLLMSHIHAHHVMAA